MFAPGIWHTDCKCAENRHIASLELVMRRAHANLRHAVFLVAACAPAVTTLGTSSAQEQRAPAFTTAQVERGKAIYGKNCQDCHGSTLDNGEFGGAPLNGSYFKQHWGAGTVAGLVAFMKAKMPPDRPGSLSDQSCADLAAFLLDGNGYPKGDKELPPDAASQQAMSLKRGQ
jgi:mono/diheme cytochrome c family protein